VPALQSAHYTYDGDGNMVKSVVNGVVTYYPSAQYQQEVSGSTTTIQKTYVFGSLTVAVRTVSGSQNVLNWVITDQISSTTVTASATGDLNSEIRYTAFGTIRYENGITPSDYRYTGQLQQAVIGLDYYNARWYDPDLGRFIQADTVVANPYAASNYDRYSYTNNNPVKYNDPTGHRFSDNPDDWETKYLGQMYQQNTGVIPVSDDSSYSYKGAYGQGTDSGQVAASNFAKKVANGYTLGWENYERNASSCISQPGMMGANLACNYANGWLSMHLLVIGSVVYSAWGALAGGGTACEFDTSCGNGVTTFNRYMSAGELKAINNTSFLRGGDPGDTFFTTDVYTTVSEAQQGLSLKNLPDYGVSFQIINDPIISEPQTVLPKFLQPGGGIEYWTSNPVLVSITDVWELLK
jgi:RHS repeat-associated protein